MSLPEHTHTDRHRHETVVDVPPCPSWCEGHPYDTHHSRTVSASVIVSADEVLDPTARQVRRGDTLILVNLDSQELTVDEARQVAAALTEAVDLVDAR